MRAIEIFERSSATKGDFKTLYCSRKLLNGKEIVEWAKSQGLPKCLDPDNMHVTVAYSKEKIDWSEMTDSFDNVRSDGGKREMALFGQNKDAVVLKFECPDLDSRWQEFKDDFGASWDFDGYNPHVTISYDGLPKGIDIDDIEPFEGVLEFGPEKMDIVDLKWRGKVKETKLDTE
jgi:hypothetical protein